MQWEYAVLSAGRATDARFVELLNQWGADGWEAVGLTTSEHVGVLKVLMKRSVNG